MSRRMTIRGWIAGSILGAAGMAIAPSALAGITWMFTNTGSVTSGGIKLTPQAVAFTNGNGSNNRLANGQLQIFSGGLGVKNADCCVGDPNEGSGPREHAVDSNGIVDGVLFKFDNAVNLTQITMGWRDTDSDLSVLRFNGDTLPAGIIGTSGSESSGKTHTELINAGWQLVGNYNGPEGNTSSPFSIPTNTSLASKFWLVTAYDSRFPLNGFMNPAGLNSYNEYVKVISLYGNPPSNGVPEPNVLLLFGAAVAGIWLTRRRPGART